MGQKKNTSVDGRKCYFCNSVENEPRLIGNYIVELTEVSIKGTAKLACQGCNRKFKTEQNYKKKNYFKSRLGFLGFWKK